MAVTHASPAASPHPDTAPPIISLLTDFGTTDYYVGAVKGVLLRHVPAATIVDISHQIEPQDIEAAAFVLQYATREFPPGSVHLAVVDPGVGTSRRILVARRGMHLFVAPDNGLLTLVLEQGAHEVRQVTHPALTPCGVGATFHGRDLFAPVAARLAGGFPFVEVGPLVADPVSGPIHRCSTQAGRLSGRVIHVDHFGTLVTNIDEHHVASLGPDVCIQLSAERTLTSLCRTYADVPPGAPLALIGSAGLLEISRRGGRADTFLGLSRGDPIHIQSH